MNCTDLDNAFDSIQGPVFDEDAGFIVAASLLLVTSCALLSHGERLVKPMSVLVGGVGGSVGVYVLSDAVSLSCDTRLIVSLLSGVLVALLALCLFKTGLVLLGAAGFGTIATFCTMPYPCILSTRRSVLLAVPDITT